MAPVQRRPQRLLPLRQITRSPGEQREPGPQHRQQGQGRVQPDPGRGQFDGQRQPVQGSADLGSGRKLVFLRREVRADGPGPRDEQPDRLAVLKIAAVIPRQIERRHPHGVLPVQPQRDPAGRQQPDRRAAHQHPGQQLDRVQHVLEVVYHEQHLAALQRLDQMSLGGLRRRWRQAQFPCQRRCDQRRITDRGQVDEGHAVGEVPGQIVGRLQSQPRLAGPADTGEGDQPGSPYRRCHLGTLALPADQLGSRGGQRCGRHPRPRRGKLLR